MHEAWIIDAARTPRGVGKQGKGALWEVHPQKLLSTVLKALVERNDLNTSEIDDVIMSCSTQFQKQGACVARMAALDAGFSTRASGVTLDRFCGGGITSVNLAAANIMSGMEELIVAGGVEMMSYTRSEAPPNPLDAGNLDLRRLYPQLNVGIAADIIATEENFSREALDAFSLESQKRAGQALDQGAFAKSLVTVYNPDGTLALDQEEYPRPQTTAESLANLQPAFEGLMDMEFFDSGRSYRELVAERWPGLEVEHQRPLHEGGLEGQLFRCQPERVTLHVFRHPFHFVKNPTRLDLADPVLDAALTLTLTHFQGLLGDRLVRKHSNPDLSAPADATGHGPTPCLNLPGRHTTATHSLQSKLTEAHAAAALGETAVAALLLLSKLCTLGLKHVSLSRSYVARLNWRQLARTLPATQ